MIVGERRFAAPARDRSQPGRRARPSSRRNGSTTSSWRSTSNEEIYITPLTFAAPTTGNQQFATLFETTFPTNYALVNTLDIVPMAWWNLDADPAHVSAARADDRAIRRRDRGAARDLQRLARDGVQAGHGAARGYVQRLDAGAARTSSRTRWSENHTIAIYKGHVVGATGIA